VDEFLASPKAAPVPEKLPPALEQPTPALDAAISAPIPAQPTPAPTEAESAPAEAAPEEGAPAEENPDEVSTSSSTSAPKAEPAVPEGRRRLDALMNEISLGGRKVRTEEILLDERPSAGVARNAMFSYMEGDNLKALLLSQAAVGEDPDNEMLRALMTTLSRVTGIEVDPEGVLPLRGLIQYELRRAELAFFDQRYGAAVQACRRALLLDPKNSTAWQRLGSAEYALGQEKEAKAAYQRALELEPNDFHLRVFMGEKGWK
jgi:Flp pilus assembly protein TadD